MEDHHWQLLRRLLKAFGSALDQPTFLDDCLDTLVEALDADRGLVVRFWPDGGHYPVNARAPGRSLRVDERSEVSRTIIEDARRAHDAILWDRELSRTDSVQSLGIIRALATPLRAPGRAEPLGVLYLDFRRLRSLPEEPERELLSAVADLLGPALVQHDDVLRLRHALRDEEAKTSSSAAPPSLEELLALPGLDAVRREVAAFLHTDETLLIEGESGTGKTLLAHAIGVASGRRSIVRATLGTSDDLNTITSELFGHERGSFSGATSRRQGLVAHADGGTLILDEVLNLSLRAQQLLLDFAQFGTYRPLGYAGSEPLRANVRLIAATNGDLPAAVEEGRFRSDLYFRLAAAAVVLPPLRDRREDIPPLAERFLHRLGGSSWRLSSGLRAQLVAPDATLPGNVRQLETAIRRGYHRASSRGTPRLTTDDVRPVELGAPVRTGSVISPARSSEPAGGGRRAPRRRPGADALVAQLRRAGGNVSLVAEELGIGRNTLYRWLKDAGIAPGAGRQEAT
ncbi:MAG: sigma 54-interacting transcriptional regulator [Myxococcota bacterium]